MKWSRLQTGSFLLLLLFYGLLLLHKIELPIGDDLPRLIQNGKVLFTDLDILTKNVYSYTEPLQPFANHHWLSGVIFFLLHAVVGYGGLVLFKVFVLLAAFTLLFLTASKRANFWIVAWLSLPTILILKGRTLVRPEIFSYLLISVFLYLLTDAEDHPDRKRIFWLIPLQILWVNLHLFFGVGILMTGGFFLDRLMKHRHELRSDPLVRKLAIIFPVLLCSSFISPYGPRGALFSLQLNVLKEFPIPILENQSVTVWLRDWSLWSDISVPIFLGAAVIFGLSFVFAWRKFSVFYFSAFIGTSILGFKLLRAIPFFAFMFLPGAARNIHELSVQIRQQLEARWPRVVPHVVRGVTWGFVVTAVAMIALQVSDKGFFGHRFGIGLSRRSEDAAEFFLENHLKGPIFNDTDIGSYLIYYLYPQEQVFIDNRFGDAYSLEFVRDVYLPMIQNEEVWQQKQAEYNFNVLFLYGYDKGSGFRDFLFRRAADPDWVLVHIDVYNVIFVRNIPENQIIINAYGITPENVGDRLAYLTEYGNKDDMVAAADAFNLVGRIDLGIQTFLKIVTTWPNFGRIWLILGEWELSFDDGRSPILAMMYLERAISLDQKSAEAYAYLGAAYIRMGLYDKAEEVLHKAARLNPNRTDVPELLNTVAERRQYEPIPEPIEK